MEPAQIIVQILGYYALVTIQKIFKLGVVIIDGIDAKDSSTSSRAWCKASELTLPRTVLTIKLPRSATVGTGIYPS